MKRKRSWTFRLDDMLQYIDKLQFHTAEKKIDHFVMDELMHSGCIRWLSIIGEAANHVPKETQKLFPDIPWQKIIGLRNIVVHDYMFEDLPFLWLIIQNELAPLRIKIVTMKNALKDNLEQ